MEKKGEFILGYQFKGNKRSSGMCDRIKMKGKSTEDT